MAVPQPEAGHGGQVGARRFAPDRHQFRSKAVRRVPVQPKSGSLAVVGAGRIGVLGRQAVVGGDHDETGGIGQPFQHRVMVMGAAQHPSPAVDVKEHPPGLAGRGYDPETERSGPSLHSPGIGPLGVDQRPEHRPSLLSRLTGHVGPHLIDLGEMGGIQFQRPVEGEHLGRRLGGNLGSVAGHLRRQPSNRCNGRCGQPGGWFNSMTFPSGSLTNAWRPASGTWADR